MNRLLRHRQTKGAAKRIGHSTLTAPHLDSNFWHHHRSAAQRHVRCCPMRLYLTESQVPELKPLPRSARRLAVRQALAMMRGKARVFCWLPPFMCVAGGVVGALVGVELLGYAGMRGYVQKPAGVTGDWIMLSAIWSYSGVGLGAVSAGFVGLHFQRARLRPYLRKTTGDRENATQST